MSTRSQQHDAHNTDRVIEIFPAPDGGAWVSGLSPNRVAQLLTAGGVRAVLHEADEPSRRLVRTGLSQREVDIVRLIASGLSNMQIAEQEFLSVNTVKSNIRTAYRKMGVMTRSQAVLWAVEHGLAPGRSGS